MPSRVQQASNYPTSCSYGAYIIAIIGIGFQVVMSRIQNGKHEREIARQNERHDREERNRTFREKAEAYYQTTRRFIYKFQEQLEHIKQDRIEDSLTNDLKSDLQYLIMLETYYFPFFKEKFENSTVNLVRPLLAELLGLIQQLRYGNGNLTVARIMYDEQLKHVYGLWADAMPKTDYFIGSISDMDLYNLDLEWRKGHPLK